MPTTPTIAGQVLRWALGLLAVSVVAYLGLQLYTPKTREVPTARVERRDFVTTVRARGEIDSARSVEVTAPNTPDLTIVRLATDGKPIEAGAVVVEFDSATQEERYVQQTTQVRKVDSEIVQAQAQHSIADEQNAMLVMRSQYDLERAKLEASKQEILSEIEGLKNRITVGVSEGELSKTQINAKATDISQEADITRLDENKAKAQRDLDRTKGYLQNMVLRAPRAGIVQVKQNPRAQGASRRSRPPFQEGDSVWAGATIAEIPDLTSMRAELRLEEIDRGRVREGQPVTIRVDAVPGATFQGKVTWLSPIATLVFRRFPPEKNFPAHASIDNLDDRLRPGMSGTVDIVVERRADVLVIPTKASFQIDGKPTVFIKTAIGFRRQSIDVVARNSNDIVIGDSLKEGEVIALENPEIADRRRRS